MIGVITGDVAKSRNQTTDEWQSVLKNVLKKYGKTPIQWEIFRGDSFQLGLAPVDALLAAIHIKAAMKQLPELDVRIGIGIGEQDFQAKSITESTGTAFILSGSCFDALKKESIALKTNTPQFDETMNLMLSLALLTMNNWTETVSSVIFRAIEHPKKSQVELAELLNKSQSSISEALKRGGFEEVKQLEEYYRKHVITV
jgi:hypothetical protein